MTQNRNERYVRQEEDPELFEHLDGLMFAGQTHIELEGEVYNIARGENAHGGQYVYVLSRED